MTHDNGNRFDIGHPAPGRGAVRDRWLWFGFLAAPVAWSLQLAFNSGLSGLACLGGAATPDVELVGWTEPAIVIVNVGALAIALVGLAVSVRNLRKTHDAEAREGRGVLGAAEGRTRYMSVWGIFTSILFFCAIAFNTVAAFWEGLCLD